MVSKFLVRPEGVKKWKSCAQITPHSPISNPPTYLHLPFKNLCTWWTDELEQFLSDKFRKTHSSVVRLVLIELKELFLSCAPHLHLYILRFPFYGWIISLKVKHMDTQVRKKETLRRHLHGTTSNSINFIWTDINLVLSSFSRSLITGCSSVCS